MVKVRNRLQRKRLYETSTGIVEIAQIVKCSLCKHEDQNLQPL